MSVSVKNIQKRGKEYTAWYYLYQRTYKKFELRLLKMAVLDYLFLDLTFPELRMPLSE